MMTSYAAEKEKIRSQIRHVENIKQRCDQMRAHNEDLHDSLNSLVSAFASCIRLSGQIFLGAKIQSLNKDVESDISSIVSSCESKIKDLNAQIKRYEDLERQSAMSG